MTSTFPRFRNAVMHGANRHLFKSGVDGGTDCIGSGQRGDTTRLSREIDGPIQVGEGGGLTKKPYIRIALHLRNTHCIEKPVQS